MKKIHCSIKFGEAFVLALAAAVCFFVAGSAWGSPLVVTSFGDETPQQVAPGGKLTLRQAIAEINGNSGGVIQFNLGGPGVIYLTNGPLIIQKNNLTIQGPGASQLGISGLLNAPQNLSSYPAHEVFVIGNGVTQATISGLTIADGEFVSYQGCGVDNSGSLTLKSCIVFGNGSGNGDSGIYNEPTGTMSMMNSLVWANNTSIDINNGNILGMSNCWVIYNLPSVGGLYVDAMANGEIFNGKSQGNLAMTNCWVAENGNGLGNFASAILIGCTISLNQGGVYNGANIGGELMMTNCTVASNGPAGPGIATYSGSASVITCCTISANADPGSPNPELLNNSGIVIESGSTLLLQNSIVSGNPGTDVYQAAGGALTSSGYNLIGTMTGVPASVWQATDQLSVDNPHLGYLRFNGGLTPTMLPSLSPRSAAVDQGFNFGLTTDQRGSTRPIPLLPMSDWPAGGNGTDIGAVELAKPPLYVIVPPSSKTSQTPQGHAIVSFPGDNVPPLGPLLPNNSFASFGLQTIPANGLASGNWSQFSGILTYYNSNNLYAARDPLAPGPGALYRLAFPATNVNFAAPAATLPATAVSNTSAVLQGATTPLGSGAQYWFEYGQTIYYGQSSPTNSLATSTNLANLSYALSGLTTSNAYHYQMVVTDDVGTQLGGDQWFVPGCYAAPGGLAYWWRGEGNTLDSVGANNGTAQPYVFYTSGEVGQAFEFVGGDFVSTSTLIDDPQIFSLCLWFETTTTNGGGLISFDSTQTATSGSQYDRNIYMDDTGALHFGFWNAGPRQVNSAPGYNDGKWHLAVGTLSASAGLAFYLDGALVGTNPATGPQAYNGYWRFGQANLNNWPNLPTSEFYLGALDEVAVFNTVLTVNQVAAIYAAGHACVRSKA